MLLKFNLRWCRTVAGAGKANKKFSYQLSFMSGKQKNIKLTDKKKWLDLRMKAVTEFFERYLVGE